MRILELFRMMINTNEIGKPEEKPKMDPLFPRLYINDHSNGNNASITEKNLGQKPVLNPSSTMLIASPFFNHDSCTSGKKNSSSMYDSCGSSTSTHMSLNSPLETPTHTGKLKTLKELNLYNDKNTTNNKGDQENKHEVKINLSPIQYAYGDIPSFQRQLKQSTSTDLRLRQYEGTTRLYPSTSKSHEPPCLNPKKISMVDYITRYVDPNTHSHQSILEDDNKALVLAEARKRYECNKVVTDISAPQAQKVEKNYDILQLGSTASPNVVLKVMGQKLFWEIRSTILRQQSVFAVQLFELHRLIQVQRLIARSPKLILGGTKCRRNPSTNMSFINMPYGNSLPTIPKKEIQYDIPNPNKNWAAKSEVTKIPLHSLKNETIKDKNPESNGKSDNKSSPFAGIKTDLAPLYFHTPPGNQWLVPVRSPSEGLIYKPYTGACPPNAGVVGPICGSVPIAPTYVGFLPGTPIVPTYFTPYGVSLMNPFANRADNELSVNIPYQTSCNTPRHKSRESDLQGSTGSSNTERTRGEPLPLFPTEPTAQISDETAKTQNSTEKPTQVIKVVPRNPKSATESVARIFRSIQEERKVHNQHV